MPVNGSSWATTRRSDHYRRRWPTANVSEGQLSQTPRTDHRISNVPGTLVRSILFNKILLKTRIPSTFTKTDSVVLGGVVRARMRVRRRSFHVLLPHFVAERCGLVKLVFHHQNEKDVVVEDDFYSKLGRVSVQTGMRDKSLSSSRVSQANNTS